MEFEERIEKLEDLCAHLIAQTTMLSYVTGYLHIIQHSSVEKMEKFRAELMEKVPSLSCPLTGNASIDENAKEYMPEEFDNFCKGIVDARKSLEKSSS